MHIWSTRLDMKVVWDFFQHLGVTLGPPFGSWSLYGSRWMEIEPVWCLEIERQNQPRTLYPIQVCDHGSVHYPNIVPSLPRHCSLHHLTWTLHPSLSEKANMNQDHERIPRWFERWTTCCMLLFPWNCVVVLPVGLTGTKKSTRSFSLEPFLELLLWLYFAVQKSDIARRSIYL
jgi:hypothetical protein